jgi:hypothetical protein
MYDHVRSIVLRLTRRFFPPTGNHRQRAHISAELSTCGRANASAVLLKRAPTYVIEADDIALVRPYVLAAEEWAERRGVVPPRPRAWAS